MGNNLQHTIQKYISLMACAWRFINAILPCITLHRIRVVHKSLSTNPKQVCGIQLYHIIIIYWYIKIYIVHTHKYATPNCICVPCSLLLLLFFCFSYLAKILLDQWNGGEKRDILWVWYIGTTLPHWENKNNKFGTLQGLNLKYLSIQNMDFSRFKPLGAVPEFFLKENLGQA